MLLKELYYNVDPFLYKKKQQQYKSEEEEQLNSTLEKKFLNDNTSLEDFDIKTIRKIISVASEEKPKVKRQAEEMLKDWEEILSKDSYIDNDLFNKLYKQFEQLKDSNDPPIIQFNKLYSLTKEVMDNASTFEEWKNSKDAKQLKWEMEK